MSSSGVHRLESSRPDNYSAHSTEWKSFCETLRNIQNHFRLLHHDSSLFMSRVGFQQVDSTHFVCIGHGRGEGRGHAWRAGEGRGHAWRAGGRAKA